MTHSSPVRQISHNISVNNSEKKKIPAGLCGTTTETEVTINGITTTALLDTGSTVSTLSQKFYDTFLQHLPIKTINQLLQIECADGQSLPYTGYIETEIFIKQLNQNHRCLFLIVPDSDYNSTVPLIIGTNLLLNIMDICRNQHGPKFLQTARLTTPWYTSFRCIAMREKELEKASKLAVIKSAERKTVTIPPNSNICIAGYIDKALPYHLTAAMIQSTSQSVIPSDLDIAPSLVDFNYGVSKLVDINISNITTRTVTFPPKSIIAELQPVSIQNQPTPENQEFTIPLLDQVKIDVNNLSSDELTRGKDFITSFSDIFSKSDTDVGHTHLVKHKIELEDERPFKQKYRGIPPSQYEEVKSHIHQLLQTGIIRKSHSPFSSNVVLVKKKDGSLRLCVDYRLLNSRTKKDAYALPRIEHILDCLGGNRYFSVIDMKAGYLQCDIFDAHKERTAFTVGPLGLYEYNRMPFGLTNAPATYQRLMQECLSDYHMNICCIFIDDVIIFSKTYEEHLDRLEKIFNRIREANLKLSPGKCSFFMPKVKYVGHIISKDGIETDPEKIEKVVSWPTPTTPEEVRRFIGFAGYYRRFIQNFSQIARPLTDIMPTPKPKTGKKKKKEQQPWTWSDKQEKAFNQLKQQLASAPVLAYPDYQRPFELHTDASGLGLGAVLYQEQEGHLRVIAYASRGLSKTERNYPAHKMEFLALKWSITDKFHDYLFGHQFRVVTDNNPLTYVLTSAKLDSTGHRWLSALGAYDFDIVYRPGKSNLDADALSRLPAQQQEESVMSSDSVKAICGSIATPFVDTLALAPDVMDTMNIDMHMTIENSIDWSKVQQADPDLKPWIDCVRKGSTPKKGQLPPSPLKRHFDQLKLYDDILYREITTDGKVTRQLVLPSSHVPVVLECLHNEMGHPGRDRTNSLVRDRFYWPAMTKDIDEWIQHCDRCLKRKKDPHRAPLINITSSQPMELVCLDFLTLEPSKGGIQNILVITDHYTRYAQAVPTRNQTARTTAEALFNCFVVHYGIPKRLHSDQGQNFESKVIKELCQLLGIKKSRTTPYHPMGNGMTERFNRTLLGMLGTLQPHQKTNWKSHVAPLVHAYNCTRHEATSQSPFFLMFGREPNLPIDIALGLTTEADSMPKSKYIQELRERLVRAYDIASKAAEKARSKQKEGYDIRTRGATLELGDRVLVKVVAHDGKHKIADRWEDDVYIIMDQPNTDVPVYTVQKESGEGRKRTLHRNLLLPVGFITERKPAPPPRPVPAPRTRTRTRREPSPEPSVSDYNSSDDESFVPVRIVHHPDFDADATLQDTDSQIQEDSEPIGDAHSTASGVSGDDSEDYDTKGSASTDTPVQQQQDTAEQEEAPADTSPGLRRSSRVRKEPGWMRSGEYVTKFAAPVTQQWQQKASFITDCIHKGLFSGLEKQAGEALLSVITKD